MYDRFKNALDDFTEKNKDVCEPVEAAIDAMHKLLQDLGPGFAELAPRAMLEQSGGAAMSEAEKMRFMFLQNVVNVAHATLDQLVGHQMNAANVNDLARRARGKLIVAKGVFDGKARD